MEQVRKVLKLQRHILRKVVVVKLPNSVIFVFHSSVLMNKIVILTVNKKRKAGGMLILMVK